MAYNTCYNPNYIDTAHTIDYIRMQYRFFMNKNIITTLLLAALMLVVPASVQAATTCTPIYGGGQSCVTAGNLVINKKIAKPGTSVFFDNLGSKEAFSPDQAITFQIVVTNNGGATLPKVTVKDVFPAFVSFVSGPGNFDANSKTLTFELENLAPNESRTFTIGGKIVPATQLPNDMTVICNDPRVLNQAIAIVDGQVQDNAQFCIQKQVTTTTTKGGLKVFAPPAVTTTPPTGPEALALVGLIPTGALGYFLRKKSQV
jgi:uncharacterized repeat protein (TIGR01451 family)